MFWGNALALLTYHPFYRHTRTPPCPPCTQGHLLRPLPFLTHTCAPPVKNLSVSDCLLASGQHQRVLPLSLFCCLCTCCVRVCCCCLVLPTVAKPTFPFRVERVVVWGNMCFASCVFGDSVRVCVVSAVSNCVSIMIGSI